MLVISNHLIGKMPIPEEAVIRINLAWIDNLSDANRILDESKNDVYLDFPSGRTKPPQPKIGLNAAMALTQHKSVKYFAVSNCENTKDMQEIMKEIDVEFIPKIETKLGIKNMQKMVDIGIKTFMLDKEDLYVDVNCDSKRYSELVEEARKFNIIELQGVVFI